MVDGGDFHIGLTACGGIDPLDGSQDECRLWQNSLFRMLLTAILWGTWIVHEAIEFTTNTTALLSYLPARLLR